MLHTESKLASLAQILDNGLIILVRAIPIGSEPVALVMRFMFIFLFVRRRWSVAWSLPLMLIVMVYHVIRDDRGLGVRF